MIASGIFYKFLFETKTAQVRCLVGFRPGIFGAVLAEQIFAPSSKHASYGFC